RTATSGWAGAGRPPEPRCAAPAVRSGPTSTPATCTSTSTPTESAHGERQVHHGGDVLVDGRGVVDASTAGVGGAGGGDLEDPGADALQLTQTASGGRHQPLAAVPGVAAGVGQEVRADLGQLGVEVLGRLRRERDPLGEEAGALLDDVGDLPHPWRPDLERPGELVAAGPAGLAAAVGAELGDRLGVDRLEADLAVGGARAPEERLHPADPGGQLPGGVG